MSATLSVSFVQHWLAGSFGLASLSRANARNLLARLMLHLLLLESADLVFNFDKLVMELRVELCTRPDHGACADASVGTRYLLLITLHLSEAVVARMVRVVLALDVDQPVPQRSARWRPPRSG